ncbi:hypothetical protein C8R44DRAFT_865420 [Mycena epipterygia]|nr:hypothetical protein C8R44DRAFT_865420 [Mycena epipterygia]
MDSTIGAVEIGTLLSGVLFGLITSQTYVYYKTYPRDSRFTKGLVGALWIVELVHTACIFDALYMYTVRGYGDPTYLIRFPVSLDATIILHGATVIIGTPTLLHPPDLQIRAKTYYLTAVAIFILFVRFAAFVVSGVAATRMSALLDFMQSWKSLILFDLISCAITDVMMSAILVYHLATRRATVYKSTLAIMDKLIMWSVETCLVTTFTTIVMMICFLTMGEKNFIWIGILLVQPKIFSNALLANLNSRASLRDAGSDLHEMTSNPSKPARFTPGTGTGRGVSMSKQSETFNDKFEATTPVDDKFCPESPATEGGRTHAIALDSLAPV